jgi:hypothetical protein
MIDIEIVWMSGILAGVFFILNFATCFAMPWAKRLARFKFFTNHKPLAYLTVITGTFHIIVSILWYFGV